MPDTKLCLEALSALSGCNVEATTGSSQITSQDFVNIVALREFYKQEGFKELEYPSLGTLSLQDLENQDMYSAPPALTHEPVESLKTTVKINTQDFFHPQYDYDFTGIKDGDKVFMRGNEKYIRPCGWKRTALRVLQKYEDGDSWLGTGKDAWPVSYHGHNMDGSLGIIITHDGPPDNEPNFLDAGAAALRNPDTRGRGVYSTPDIKMAEKHCKTFKYSVDGMRYKVVLQNRINPQKRKSCQREGIWLVYIPEGSTNVQEKVIIEESLRPYGLLIKQV
ncbi:uncharacterized protein LOC122844148 [Gambusia affinis]|uniref:uncharacterized protein LOC122844148 n=1 Tax=Gambusia affinis TaxID=33528 RepID=UPI001CDCCF93|nr:uncharacterized protein LOC122844148 [Gambusia affinis]